MSKETALADVIIGGIKGVYFVVGFFVKEIYLYVQNKIKRGRDK